MGSWKPDRPSKRQYVAAAGPAPTLSSVGEWFWLGCHVCLHSVATKPVIFMNQLGPDYPLEGLRKRGWCTVCGSFGAYTQMPSHVDMQIGDKPYDEEQSYHTYLRSLDEAGMRSFVVYDQHTRAILRDALTIAQAVRWVARASGVDVWWGGRNENRVGLLKDQEVFWSVPVDVDRRNGEKPWPEIFRTLVREHPFKGRYRAGSFDQYRLAVAGKAAEARAK